MTRIVINGCYGGFALSLPAIKRLAMEGVSCAVSFLANREVHSLRYYEPTSVPRQDSRLVKVVEDMGKEANTDVSDLEIVEVESTIYRVREREGLEYVEEMDLTGWTVVS